MFPTKLLIADDDVTLLQTLRIRLQSEGFEVVLAQQPDRVVALAEAHRPDVIVADTTERCLDGRPLAAHLRETGPTTLVHLSAVPAEVLDHTTLDAAVLAVLAKPFDADGLIEAVRAAIATATRAAG